MLDVVIFVYRYIMFELLEEDLQAKFYIFNTFFYTRLSNASMDDKALR